MSKLRDLDQVKINKSGRFAPDIIKRVQVFCDTNGLTFSQGLEELTDIGLHVIGDSYKVLSRKSSMMRKPIGSFILESLKESASVSEVI